MHTIKENAYAKINLFLDVLCKRSDGFHDIRSVMQTVSLCDEVILTVSDANTTAVTISVTDGPYVPADGRNLACVAAQLFLKKAALCRKVHIHLTKRIPTAAGMAGGSSDAAAVLRGMNKLCGTPFSTRALLSMAEQIGSDVPFCLLGHTALCEGRGEKMVPLRMPQGVWFVAACADESISAKAAYAALDEVYSDFDGRVKTGGEEAFEQLLAWLRQEAPLPDRLFNVFEDTVMAQCSGARHIRERLRREGASPVLLSGSGPSVFGVFIERAAAEQAAAQLCAEGIRAFFMHAL